MPPPPAAPAPPPAQLSSLASQLQKLGGSEYAYGTGAGKYAGKQRPSFLFDWHQAADYDIDTIYSIGCNGLKELVQLNKRFASFEETLFGAALKEVDRVLRDKEFNRQLDKSIAEFLTLLSEHFLVKAAGKALEWLIRRFRINEFNVEQVLRCILPYHETKLFHKMIMTLQIETTSRWSFINDVVRTNEPMERAYFVRRLYADRSLLNFVCTMVSDNVEQQVIFSTEFTFYAATVVTYLNSTTRVPDDTINVLLPFLLNGIRSPVHDWRLCNWMVLGQIAMRVALKAKALADIVDILAHNVDGEQCPARELALLLLSLSVSQESWPKTMPQSATRRVLASVEMNAALAELSQSYACDALVTSYVRGAVALMAADKSQQVQYGQSLVAFLRLPMLKLSPATYKAVAAAVVSGALGLPAGGDGSPFAGTLATLQTLSVDAFGQSITTAMTECKQDAAKHHKLYSLLSPLVAGTTHAALEQHDTTALLALSHPLADVRMAGLVKLDDVLRDSETHMDPVDAKAVSTSLLDLLGDEDDHAVLSTLLKSRNLTAYLAKADTVDQFVSALVGVFYRSHDALPLALLKLVLHCAMQCASVPAIMAHPDAARKLSQLILTHLLASRDAGALTHHILAIVQEGEVQLQNLAIPLLKTGLAAMQSHAQLLLDGQQKPAALDQYNAQVLKALSAAIVSEQDTQVLFDMLRSAVTSADRYVEAAVACLLIAASVSKRHQLAEPVLRQLTPLCVGLIKRHTLGDSAPVALSFSASSLTKHRQQQQQQPQSIDAHTLVQAAMTAFTTCVKAAATRSPAAYLDVKYCQLNEQPSSALEACIHVYRAVMALPEVLAYEAVVSVIMELYLPTLAPFLCAQLIADGKSVMLLLRTLGIISSIVKARAEDFQLLVPTLLTVLMHPAKQVRQAALECLTSIKQNYESALNGGKMPKGKVCMTIHMVHAFYGERTPRIKFLETANARTLLDWLLADKDAVATDHLFLPTLFQQRLMRDKKTDKKTASMQDAVLMNLLSHITAFEFHPFQATILNILAAVYHPLKFKELSEYFEQVYTQLEKTPDVQLLSLTRLYISGLNEKAASALTQQPACFELLRRFLRGHASHELVSVQLAALQQLTPSLWSRLKHQEQEALFEHVLNAVAYSEERDVVVQAKEALKTVGVASSIVWQSLNALNGLLREKDRSTKRNKMDRAQGDELSHKMLQLIALLEFLTYRTSADGDQLSLIQPLFENVALVANTDRLQLPVSLEYPKQLCLGLLNTLINDAHEKKLNVNETLLRVEALVQCIRSTDNPQTHNATLLLLSSIALLYPEKVLHNIMPVFTFMGANVLRHDDEYTFQVIERTIERIVPPLVRGDNKTNLQGHALIVNCRPVLKVFVDAIWHIPVHRRLRLFTVLVNTLGPTDFLGPVIALLLEKEQLSSKAPAQPATAINDSLLEFSLLVAPEFSAAVQTRMVVSLLTCLQDMPDEVPVAQKHNPRDPELSTKYLLDLTDHTTASLRLTKLAIGNFIDELLVTRAFLSSMTASESKAKTEENVRHIINTALAYASQLSTLSQTAAAADVGLAKFAKTMLRSMYAILDKIHNLLPLPSFLAVIGKVWQGGASIVRRKALQLLNDKLGVLTPQTAQRYQGNILATLSSLAKGLLAVKDKGEEAAINKQTALVCFSTIVGLLGARHADVFTHIIKTVLGPTCLTSGNYAVAASALISLTQACRTLGPRMVPFVPELVKELLTILEQTTKDSEQQRKQQALVPLLQLSALATLEAVVHSLPQFVSPYLARIFANLLHPRLVTGADDEADAAPKSSSNERLQVAQKVDEVAQAIAELVQARLLVPPLVEFWSKAVQYGKTSIMLYLSLIKRTVGHMDREAISTLSLPLFTGFLKAFDFRRQQTSGLFSAEDVDQVETDTVDAFVGLVFKLNEALFKPMFLKIYDWAVVELADGKAQALPADAGHTARLCTFYRFANQALDRLRGVFTPYCAYALDNAIGLLNAFAGKGQYSDERRELNGMLWVQVVTFVTRTFECDRDGLLTQEVFDKLVPALAQQLMTYRSPVLRLPSTSAAADGADEYSKRMDMLQQCMVQLAVVSANDASWKQLNAQVLSATRYTGSGHVDNGADASSVKIAALRIIKAYYHACGEPFMVLLPETIPYLAECMEDDDVMVEKTTQDVVAEIEQHLGESLQKVLQLNKGDEADTEVSWTDQQKINAFSNLNNRVQDMESQYEDKKQQKEALDDVAQELELCDEDELVKYRIGDVFMSLPYAEVQELLSNEQSAIDSDIEKLKEKLDSVHAEMEHLKVELYSRFGNAINLERD
ncbi:snoRNA-binding rRNA-processing protein utp10 [Sorochytrium milnesiophthora]